MVVGIPEMSPTVKSSLGQKGGNGVMSVTGHEIETITVIVTATEIMIVVATTGNEAVSTKETGKGEEIILMTDTIDGLARTETTASTAGTTTAMAMTVGMTVTGIITQQRK